jgi:predicted nuclease of predicted toxin-antitoxin system
VRFLIDAQLPPDLASLFVSFGFEAVHVLDVGLLHATDNQIRVYAIREKMVIVTKDEDFAIMKRLTPKGPQIVWIRIGNTTKRVLMERMRPRMKEVVDALLAGEAIVEVR